MRGKRLHYGYVIAALLFVTQIMVFVGSRSMSIALLDIQASLGVSMAEMGFIVAWYGGTANLGSVLWGGIGDKRGPRWSAIAAGLIFSVGMILCGLFGGSDYRLALVLWTIVGFGSSGLQETVIPKMLSAWFVPSKRGSALRFIMPGGPVASMILGVIMPIGIAKLGWGGMFVFLGIVSLAFTMSFVLLKVDPAEKGLKPVGYVEGGKVATDQEEIAQPDEPGRRHGFYYEALHLPITWHIGIIYALYQFYFVSNTTYYVSAIRSIGFAPEQAGLVVLATGITSVCAMQVWGPLSDRIGRKRTLQIILTCASVLPLGLFFVYQSAPAYIVLCICLLVVQFFCFSGAPAFMAILSDYFPTRLNATCNGVVCGISAIGSFVAPWLGGFIIDACGATYFYCIPVAVGAFLCWLAVVRLPKTIVDEEPSERGDA